MNRLLLSIGALFLGFAVTHAADWAQFRGQEGSGVTTEKGLPVKWSKDKGVLWKVPLLGRANSSPAVITNRVDLTTQLEDHSLWILSFNRKDGKLRLKTRVGTGTLATTGPAKLYAHRHNAATPSPIADEEHIWAFFGSGLLVCVDAGSGKVVWKKDMNKEYGSYNITFGMGSSPRLWNDLLIINCMTKGPSYVVAFNKKTGRQVWYVKRKLPAKNDGPDAYSTPSLVRIEDREVLLVSGSDHVNAYDPRTGKPIWVSGGLTIASIYGRVIASATSAQNIVVATSANPGTGTLGRVIALKGTGKGDITRSNRLWTYNKSTPDSSTPVCYQGRVYMVSDKGVGTCLELKTGKVIWRQRVGTGPYHASVIAGDGKVYFLGIDGTCTVVKAGTKGTILASNVLPDGTFYATPAIRDGKMYLRSYSHLYAIGGRN